MALKHSVKERGYEGAKQMLTAAMWDGAITTGKGADPASDRPGVSIKHSDQDSYVLMVFCLMLKSLIENPDLEELCFVQRFLSEFHQ